MAIEPIHLAAYLLNPASHGIELDPEEDIKAMQYIYELGQHLKINVMKELADYKAKDNFWKNRFIWSQVEETDALSWWKGICSSTKLHKIAVAILSAPYTSAATERTFSTQADVHTKKRNKLTTERAGKITYISHNWNLENRPSSIDTESDFHMDSEPFSPTSEIDEISCDCNEPVLLNTPEIDPLASDPIDVPNSGDFEESSVSSSN